MTLKSMNLGFLAQTTSAVVKRADVERLTDAGALLASMQEAANQQQARLAQQRQEAVRGGHEEGVELGKQAWAQELTRRHVHAQVQLKAMHEVLVGVLMSSLQHLLGALPDAQRFRLLAGQVLQEAIRARQLRLVVAPSDAATARELLDQWQERHPDLLSVDVLADIALSPGDCVLETDEGAIDGRLGQRLNAIAQALSQHLATGVPAHSLSVPVESP